MKVVYRQDLKKMGLPLIDRLMIKYLPVPYIAFIAALLFLQLWGCWR